MLNRSVFHFSISAHLPVFCQWLRSTKIGVKSHLFLFSRFKIKSWTLRDFFHARLSSGQTHLGFSRLRQKPLLINQMFCDLIKKKRRLKLSFGNILCVMVQAKLDMGVLGSISVATLQYVALPLPVEHPPQHRTHKHQTDRETE